MVIYVIFIFASCDEPTATCWRRRILTNLNIIFNSHFCSVFVCASSKKKSRIEERKKKVFSLNMNHAVHSDQSYASSWVIIQFAALSKGKRKKNVKMTKPWRSSRTAPSLHPTAAIRMKVLENSFEPIENVSSYRLYDCAIRRHHQTICTNYSLANVCAHRRLSIWIEFREKKIWWRDHITLYRLLDSYFLHNRTKKQKKKQRTVVYHTIHAR